MIKEHLDCYLAIDLEGQDHILFPMIDNVGSMANTAPK